MELDIQSEQGPSQCEITLRGEIDIYTAPKLKERLVATIEGGCANVIVNLEEVTFIDSSGLGLLLSLSKEYGAQGGRLILITNETVDNILSLTRLNGIFSTAATFPEAEELLADTRA